MSLLVKNSEQHSSCVGLAKRILFKESEKFSYFVYVQENGTYIQK